MSARIGGVDRLVYGEAVGGTGAPLADWSIDAFVTPGQGGPVVGMVHRAVLSQHAADELFRGVAAGRLVVDAAAISTAGVQLRPPVIVPVRHSFHSDAGASINPDGRLTYRLEEWWCTTENTLQGLWDTRHFESFVTAVASRTGLKLHDSSERIGNFLHFERLSSVVIHRFSPDEGTAWVRALDMDPLPSPRDYLANIRFLFSNETIAEKLVPLPPDGVAIAVPQGYSTVSVSVHAVDTGELLARQLSDVWGSSSLRTGHSESVTVLDSHNVPHKVSWTRWQGGRMNAIDPTEPWKERSSRRVLRNRQIAEGSTTRVFDGAQRPEAEQMVRELLSHESDSSSFVYIWDPYFNVSAALDFLSWVDPRVNCRILCGAPFKSNGAVSLKDESMPVSIASVLARLRSAPLLKRVECKFKVKKDGKQYRALYHDRFIITRTAAWFLGASLNGIGTKVGAVVRLSNPDPLRWRFEDEWVASSPGVAEADL